MGHKNTGIIVVFTLTKFGFSMTVIKMRAILQKRFFVNVGENMRENLNCFYNKLKYKIRN